MEQLLLTVPNKTKYRGISQINKLRSPLPWVTKSVSQLLDKRPMGLNVNVFVNFGDSALEAR